MYVIQIVIYLQRMLRLDSNVYYDIMYVIQIVIYLQRMLQLDSNVYYDSNVCNSDSNIFAVNVAIR